MSTSLLEPHKIIVRKAELMYIFFSHFEEMKIEIEVSVV